MGHGVICTYPRTMSGAVGSFTFSVDRAWASIHMCVRTMSTACSMDVYVSPDGSFYAPMLCGNDHKEGSSTTTIVSSIAGTNGGSVHIESCYKYYKFLCHENPTMPVSFCFVCADM